MWRSYDGKAIHTNCLEKQSGEAKSEYRVHLNGSIEVARQLLKGALPFRGHDENESSTRRGHFLNFLEWHAKSNENVRSALKRLHWIIKWTSPDNQKYIALFCAKETLRKML